MLLETVWGSRALSAIRWTLTSAPTGCVMVLPEFDPPGVPVSLLFQASRRGSPNVRALRSSAGVLQFR
jgi:hypothetical protein